LGAVFPVNLKVSIIIYGLLLIICKEIIHIGFLRTKPKVASDCHQEGKKA
jgi:hypothetical protein